MLLTPQVEAEAVTEDSPHACTDWVVCNQTTACVCVYEGGTVGRAVICVCFLAGCRLKGWQLNWDSWLTPLPLEERWQSGAVTIDRNSRNVTATVWEWFAGTGGFSPVRCLAQIYNKVHSRPPMTSEVYAVCHISYSSPCGWHTQVTLMSETTKYFKSNLIF